MPRVAAMISFALQVAIGAAAGREIYGSPGGVRLSEAQVAAHVLKAGFPERAVGTMVCIANYESGRWTEALNARNRNGSIDWGLFQINSSNFRYCTGTSDRAAAQEILKDPQANTACAYKLAGGKTVKHLRLWVAYRKHREECDRKASPLRGK